MLSGLFSFSLSTSQDKNTINLSIIVSHLKQRLFFLYIIRGNEGIQERVPALSTLRLPPLHFKAQSNCILPMMRSPVMRFQSVRGPFAGAAKR